MLDALADFTIYLRVERRLSVSVHHSYLGFQRPLDDRRTYSIRRRAS